MVYRTLKIWNGRELDLPDEANREQLYRAFTSLVRFLPSHPAAHGYVRGRSVETALLPHVGCTYLCHLDLRHFFHACTADAICARLVKLGMPVHEAEALCVLCTHKDCLPVGAPTSPALSNLAAWQLDEELSHFTTYTRYSDQLILSGPAPPDAGAVRRLIRSCGFRVNEAKSFVRKRGTGRMELMGYLIGETSIRRPLWWRKRERARVYRPSVGEGRGG